MRELSVFDIIGPNRSGLMSAHAIGALKMAKVAHQLAPRKIKKVTFTLYGSFAKNYRENGIDRVLVAGLLGMNEEDPRIKEALHYAQDKHLNYVLEVEACIQLKNPNAIAIKMEDSQGNIVSVMGVSNGGSSITIHKINGMEVDFNGAYHTLLISHKDQPGLAAHITNCLGNWKINIAYMRIYREHKGELALTIIETDDPICGQVVEAISNHLAVQYARIIS